jgi:hypothetical protein
MHHLESKHLRLVNYSCADNQVTGSAKSDSGRGMVQNQVEATDQQIDRLVYELYGLSDEDMAVVEGLAEEAPVLR